MLSKKYKKKGKCNEMFNLNYRNKRKYTYLSDCRVTLLDLITFNNVLLQIRSRDKTKHRFNCRRKKEIKLSARHKKMIVRLFVLIYCLSYPHVHEQESRNLANCTSRGAFCLHQAI